MNISVWTRIILRYGVGYLAAKGFIPEELMNLVATDPDLQMIVHSVIGAALVAAIEGAYKLAQKYGWPT